MIKKPCILGNWKMNFTRNEVISFLETFKDFDIPNKDEATIGFAVPHPYLQLASELVKESPVVIGSQNVHWEEKGAYTGEVSNSMLLDCGAAFSVVGHSERRILFFETNQSVSKKVLSTVNSSIKAVLCVGETQEEFKKGQTEKVLQTQVPESLSMLDAEHLSNIIIAYEPVWAIGTGLSATPAQAQAAHTTIRNLLKGLLADFSKKNNLSIQAEDIPILYGGSVKPDNAEALMQEDEIDGFLVGGASLSPQDFWVICQNAIPSLKS